MREGKLRKEKRKCKRGKEMKTKGSLNGEMEGKRKLLERKIKEGENKWKEGKGMKNKG